MIGRNVPDGAERVLPEGRTAYEAWARSLPQCVSYEGACDGNLVGLDHEPNCPMFGKEKPTFWDAWQAASRPVQQPATEPELRTRLLKIAAKVAHRQYLPSLEGCRTINDARIEVSRYDEFHAMLAQDLKSVLDEFAKARHVPVGTDKECICSGNWRKIVAEFGPLIGKRFRDEQGTAWVFFGLVHGSDDYYYGMNDRHGKRRLLSCVSNFEDWGLTQIEETSASPLAHSPEGKEQKS